MSDFETRISSRKNARTRAIALHRASTLAMILTCALALALAACGALFVVVNAASFVIH